MKKILIQVIAILVVGLMIFSISSPIISYAVNELLTEQELESQGTETDNKSVEFDICSEDNKHALMANLSDSERKVKITVNVKDAGYLDDATVDFSGANFTIIGVDKPELISENTGKQLKLNRVSGGDKIIIEATIKADIQNEIKSNFFNQDNKVVFTAKFFNEKNKEKNVKKEMMLHVSWNVEEAEVIISQNIQKYILITEGDQKGVLLQEKISTAVKDNILPIKASHIEINVPRIENELPTKVSVISTNLNGSNGKVESFNENNWKYNEDGILTIDISNEIEEDKVSWVKNAQDDFAVIYTYSENVLEKVKTAGAAIKLNTKVTDTLYNANDLNISNEITTEGTLKDQIGNIVDLNIEIAENEINKGFLYTNQLASSENKKETGYTEQYSLEISDAELTDSITIEQKNEILSSNGNTIISANSVNKNLSVNAKMVQEILGESGEILIGNNEGNIAKINKDSQINDKGNYVVDLPNIENLKIDISKPVKNGNLEFDIAKAISTDLTSEIETIKSLDEIKTNTEISTGNSLPVNKVEDSAKLIEPTSKATIALNKDSFSTISKNNKIEINAILESDSIDDKLHNDTILEIKLPSYIQEVNLTNCNVLYSEELIKSSERIIDTENGKVIQILLSGTQTTYNSNVEKGINVVINADLTIDRLTPSKTEKINLTYKEGNEDTIYTVSKDINFVAPTGLVTVNELENYARDAKSISLVSKEDEENVAYIDAYSDSHIATYKGQIINNYKNDISEAKILGSIPNTEKEGNTFNTVLNGIIKVDNENVDVYYSEKADANNDLNNAANGWTKQITDFAKVKSYLMVVKENMQQGSSIKFEMPITIPENISFENTDKINYAVSYNNNTSVGTIPETVAGNDISITTGNGPLLEAEISMDERAGTSLKQSQHANFTVTVKNTGSDATNVKLIVDETYGKVQVASYHDFQYKNSDNEFFIGDIKAGETKTINYIYTINPNAELGNKEIKVSLTGDKINKAIEFSKNINIEKGYLELINLSEQSHIEKLRGGQTTTFIALLTNTSGENLTNFSVCYRVSEGSTIKEAGTKTSCFSTDINPENTTINGNIATYKVGSLAADSTIILSIAVDVGYNVDKVSTIVYTEGKNVGNNYSNVESKPVSKYNIDIKVATKDEKLEAFEGQEIEYNYVIENIGEIESTVNNIKAIIPKGAKIKYAEVGYTENGEAKTRKVYAVKENEINILHNLINVGDKITIKIVLETEVFSEEEIKKGIEEKELSMALEFSSELLKDKKSDPINYYVIYNEKIHNKLIGKEDKPEDPTPEKPEDPKPETKKYKISGKVWLDVNKNDRQDESEEGISGIKVQLIDLSTMEFTKNRDGKEIEVQTSNDGTYTFTDLVKGKYIVVFDYENTDYNVSQYHKEGVANSVNSDAIEKIISIDGKEKTVGLSDTLEISDSNIRNIDLGLSKSSKFNIELTKRVNKVTINNENGISDYNYSKNPKALGKVEIKDKYLDSSNVIIEYTITVKNTGDVTGYVTNIVDYIPDELKFNSELNKDWYLGTDGNAYNMSLAKVELRPTESKDVTIILSKKMTEDNTGLVNNDAEIFDAYNNEGIANIDAVPGNKNKSENDMSTAGVVVSVKTGETVTKYTILIVVIIAILTFGIYMIKIKILDKKI